MGYEQRVVADKQQTAKPWLVSERGNQGTRRNRRTKQGRELNKAPPRNALKSAHRYQV
jgi:hypothetical protein